MSRILILLSWFFGQVLGFENTPDSITPGKVENPPPLPCLSDVNIEMSAKQKENVQQENIPKEDVQKSSTQPDTGYCSWSPTGSLVSCHSLVSGYSCIQIF